MPRSLRETPAYMLCMSGNSSHQSRGKTTPASSGGSFKSPGNLAPESVLPAPVDRSPLVALHPGSGDEVFRTNEPAAVRRIDVVREPDKDGVEQFSLFGEAQFHYDWFAPAHLDEAGKLAWVQKHEKLINYELENRYGIEPDHDKELDSTVGTVTAFAHHDGPITHAQAYDRVWEDTKLVQLYNESDDGTFGTENLSRILAGRIDGSVVLDDFNDKWAVAVELSEDDIDAAVNARIGVRELDDVTALGIARLAHHSELKTTAVTRLLHYGHADKDDARKEIHSIYSLTPVTDTAARHRLDMFQTWLLNGGDNS